MALEIAGVALDKLLSIEVSEAARFVHHAVPGQDGEQAQALGRPSVRIQVSGIVYGPSAADDLQTLRGHLLGRDPVDFFCEITGQGYFSQVLVERLEASQRVGPADEFDFRLGLVEFVPPPPPPSLNPLDGIDTSLIDEAAGLMDEVQDAMAAVSGIAGLLSGASSFGDPTSKLGGLLDVFSAASQGGVGAVGTVKDAL
ncbi:MAG: hypothetical protein RL722_1062 [Pseudomonadota bacterium]|jgi:hypothetical protein